MVEGAVCKLVVRVLVVLTDVEVIVVWIEVDAKK